MLTEGFEAVQQAIARLQKLSSEPDAIARDIGIVVERRVKLAFGAGKAPDVVAEVDGGKAAEAAGAPWAPLAQKTIDMRRNKKKGSIVILRDTSHLMQSVNSVVAGGAVTIGTGVDYGVWHQGGTKRMPARPFIGYNEPDDQQTMVKVVLRHIEAAVR